MQRQQREEGAQAQRPSATSAPVRETATAGFEPPAEVSEPQAAPAFELARTAAQTEMAFEAVREEPTPVREQPPAPVPAAPEWKMEPIELPPDLVLVETRPSAAPAVEQESEEQPRPRPSRPRPVETPSEEESLVQVETRKETEPANSNPA